MFILKAVVETLAYRTSTVDNKVCKFETREELDEFIAILRKPTTRYILKGYEITEE